MNKYIFCCFGRNIPDRKCVELANWKSRITDSKWEDVLKNLYWCDDHKIDSDIRIEENE